MMLQLLARNPGEEAFADVLVNVDHILFVTHDEDTDDDVLRGRLILSDGTVLITHEDLDVLSELLRGAGGVRARPNP
jgi:hypothetical protein